MADFPSSLPDPLAQAGFGVNPDKAFIRTDFEIGAARQRKRFTATSVQISLTWRLTSVLMVVFRTFYKTTINEGTDWFTINLDIGDGKLPYIIRFTEPYTSVVAAPEMWDVAAKLEIENA
jgi:hypothetical protein